MAQLVKRLYSAAVIGRVMVRVNLMIDRGLMVSKVGAVAKRSSFCATCFGFNPCIEHILVLPIVVTGYNYKQVFYS